MFQMKRSSPLALAVAAALLAGCASSMRINRVLADPSRYQNRNVAVTGTVTNSVGAFVAGVYEIDDGTGKLYVLSTNGAVPPKGARVRVTGNVQSGVTVLGRSFGTTLRERDRSVRN